MNTPRLLFSFLPDGHALSPFVADRQDRLAAVLQGLGPGWRCASAEIKLAGAADGSPQRLICELTDGEQQALHIWSRKRGGAEGLLYRFPEDPYVPGLGAWWANPRDAAGSPLAAPHVLRYVPTRRATILARADGDDGGSIVVKFKRPSKSDHAGDMLQAVWEAAEAGGRPVAIAKPLGSLEGLSGFCQSFLPGAAFDRGVDAGNLSAMLAKAGRVHARLHRLTVNGVPPWSLRRYADSIEVDLSLLAFLAIPGASDLAEAWHVLGPRVREARGAREVFCHGDFVPGQLLLDGDRVAVTDFDMARRGLDLQEIGKWIASLRYHLPMLAEAVRTDDPSAPRLLAEAEEAYLHGYGMERGEAIDRTAVLPFVAAAEIHYLAVWARKDRLVSHAVADAIRRVLSIA